MKTFLLSLVATVWLALPHAGEIQAMVNNDCRKTGAEKHTNNATATNNCKHTNIRKSENNNVKRTTSQKGKPVSGWMFDSMMYPVMAL